MKTFVNSKWACGIAAPVAGAYLFVQVGAADPPDSLPGGAPVVAPAFAVTTGTAAQYTVVSGANLIHVNPSGDETIEAPIWPTVSFELRPNLPFSVS